MCRCGQQNSVNVQKTRYCRRSRSPPPATRPRAQPPASLAKRRSLRRRCAQEMERAYGLRAKRGTAEIAGYRKYRSRARTTSGGEGGGGFGRRERNGLKTFPTETRRTLLFGRSAGARSSSPVCVCVRRRVAPAGSGSRRRIALRRLAEQQQRRRRNRRPGRRLAQLAF